MKQEQYQVQIPKSEGCFAREARREEVDENWWAGEEDENRSQSSPTEGRENSISWYDGKVVSLSGKKAKACSV